MGLVPSAYMSRIGRGITSTSNLCILVTANTAPHSGYHTTATLGHNHLIYQQQELNFTSHYYLTDPLRGGERVT